MESSLKLTLLWKTPGTKRCAEIFCQAFFDFQKNILLSHSELISVTLEKELLNLSSED
jgi:hypothetical protein